MGRRVKGFAAALALAFAVSATAWLSGSSTAAAAEPIVLGSCATSVQGTPGQPVSLSPSAVLGIVVDAVRAVPLLGPPLAGAVGSAFAALPPIPIGAIPTGTGYISGGTIANAVTAQLRTIPVLGAILGQVVTSVQGTLSSMCGVTVKGVNAAAAPVQEGAKSVADASQKATGGLTPGGSGGGGGVLPGSGGRPGGGGTGGGSGSGGSTGGSGGIGPIGPNQPVLGGIPGSELDQFLWTGRAPMVDYSGIPFARPGLFAPSPGVRYGGAVSGYTPQFGILGADPNRDGVAVAGNAEALRAPSGTKIAFPVLLAVFALSGVTAALVRTWVLRRAPAS